MGKVVFNNSVSLDGFVAGPNDEVDELFRWYAGGDTVVPLPGTNEVFRVSRVSAEYIRAAWPTYGAMVTGRRLFDLTKGWGGNPPLGVRHFVVTHNAPPEWLDEDWPFTFVSEGIEHALGRAKQIAGDKHVALSSATIMRQCLKAGLLDELHLDVVPVLLGQGVRLFDRLGSAPIQLERTRVLEAPDVTQFRVVK